MTENVERFSYGDFVYFNNPMVHYRVYKKNISTKFMGDYSLAVNVPFYAHTIKILKEVDGHLQQDVLQDLGAKSPEIFFITKDGNFIDLPEGQKYKVGDSVKIEGIERLVMLSAGTSALVKGRVKAVHKKDLLPSEREAILTEMLEVSQDGKVRCVAEAEGVCFTAKEITGKSFGYWYALATDEMLREKGEVAIEELVSLIEGRDSHISEYLKGELNRFISELRHAEQYNAVEVAEDAVLNKCKEIEGEVEKIITLFKVNRLGVDKRGFLGGKMGIEVKHTPNTNNLCRFFQSELSEFLNKNGAWLINQAATTVKAIGCYLSGVKC